MKNNSSLKSLSVMVVICLVIAVLMAVINMITAPKIQAADAEAEQQALFKVLETAVSFESVEGDFSEEITAVYRDTGNAGYVAMISAKGYDSSNPMKIAVGFSSDGVILKCYVVSCSGETTGIGTKVTEPEFLNQFVGFSASDVAPDAISGATISSSAFIEAVQNTCRILQEISEVDS